MTPVEIPLFPLNTVLFPGGVLPLRIFETRYLDMVSRCMKEASGFAVLAIVEGQEAGQVTQFQAVGTLARIVDFDRLDDGLLGITNRGEQRVQVVSQWTQPDRLLVGKVALIPPDSATPLLKQHAPLVELLRNILEREELQFYTRLLDEEWDNAVWVGNRLAELLPLPIEAKQLLLELNEPMQRLDLLQIVLRDQQTI
ncbi:MAG: LON peptidase substrate-binding domain-containing protein [Candidatus Competibacteraceae bacterium]